MELKSVLSKIKPSNSEYRKMEKFTEKLVRTATGLSKDAKPMICGSVAKDTWLSEKNETDLFLLFEPSISKKELETKGLSLAKMIVKKMKGKYQLAYAEHPYLKSKISKYEVDIVPCYDIEDPERIQSSVDRTPHHVKFVKARLKNPDDVRILKQFCIANKCYGADVKTLGFSGYICELLIIKYGSFTKLVKEASEWRACKVITFENLNKEEACKKFKNPLIVVDPVDSNRNVGAAVSVEKFYTFVDACKKFVSSPKKEFFFPPKAKPYSMARITKEMKKRGTKWYMITFAKPKVIDDVLYPQMKRCCKAIEKLLTQNGFRVLRCDFHCNKKCSLVYEMETWQIPKVAKNTGPDVYSRHAEEFLKHYKKKEVFIENDKWVVEVERKFTDVFDYLKNLFKMSKKEIMEKGIPSKIAPKIRKAKISCDKGFLKEARSMPEGFRVFLREWFEKDLDVV